MLIIDLEKLQKWKKLVKLTDKIVNYFFLDELEFSFLDDKLDRR